MRKLAAAALICGAPLWGWGPEGHSLVARIAEAQLTAAAKARVLEILGPGRTMASVASWADEIRRSRAETGPWHYVDIPIDKPHLDMARDCPKGDCVIAKIEEFRLAVKDPATTPEKRREDLMFLIHFVGDMHQPLHCADNKDKGGNDVRIEFNGRQSNLHSLWDSGLLGRMGKEDDLLPRLSRESQRHKDKYARGTVRDWAEQSHKLAQKMVYGRLPKGLVIRADYERKADPIVERQIEKAGARLAAMLNAALIR
jgi:S1/P1 Nuclease